MSETFYEVVYVDKFDDLLAAELFRDQLRKRFNLNAEHLNRLSSGLPVVVKKHVGFDEAERYHSAIREAGGVCWIQEQGPNGKHWERRRSQRRGRLERRTAFRASAILPDRRSGRVGRRSVD